jgi:hypothetical protein
VGVALCAGVAFAAAVDRTYASKHHYSLRVPDGWRRIDDATLRKTARTMASMTGMKTPAYEAAFELEGSESPFEYPYVLVQFVEGSTSGAYRDLENQLMKGVEEMDAKHGEKLDEIIGEHAFDRPVVDRARNRVWMSMRAETPAEGTMRGFMALHLGSKGVVQIALYTREDDAAEGKRVLEDFSNSVKFEDGYAFGEGSLFDGWMGKALIGGLIGLGVGLVRAALKSRKQKQEARAQAALTYEQPVVPSPFGRPVPRKRVPAGPIRLDPDLDG